jgi:hypothetical protein
MRSIPILIVSMGLFLACTSQPKRPRFEIPDAPPAPADPTCQEACDSNDDCGTTTTDADGGVVNVDGFCCTGDDCGSKNRCVACLANSDCTGDNKFCLEGACVGCLADDDCGGGKCNLLTEAGTKMRAKAALNSCIDCSADSECGDQLCSSYGKCKCKMNSQCTEPGMGLCRDEGCFCDEDSACTTGAKKCIPGTGVCLACAEDDDCTGDLPKCVNPGLVTAFCGCTADDQCGEGLLCNETTRKCGACGGNEDCPAGTVCTAAGTCGQCAEDADCGNGTCTAGVCSCMAAGDCKTTPSLPALTWVCE